MKVNENKAQMKIEDYLKLPYSILLHEIVDDDEKYWIAELPELPGCKSHGSSVEEAVNSLEEAKKDWISDSLKSGEEVPFPVERDHYSGKTLLRVSRSLHRALSIMAENEKVSLNQLIATILAKEVGRYNSVNTLGNKIDELLDKVNDLIDEKQKTNFVGSVWGYTGANENEGQFVVDTGTDMRFQVGNVIQVIQAAGTSFQGVGAWSPVLPVRKNVRNEQRINSP